MPQAHVKITFAMGCHAFRLSQIKGEGHHGFQHGLGVGKTEMITEKRGNLVGYSELFTEVFVSAVDGAVKKLHVPI
jgi:hypothetical protein